MRTKKNKKYRIKSKFRFITSIVVMAAIVIGIIGIVSGSNISTALTKKENIQVQVESGDTLWNIAREYKSDDKDIRKAVYEICTENDIDVSDLTPGMIIEVPYDL